MGNLTDYLIAGHEVLLEEHQRLERHNPNHELLRYITIDSDKKGFNITQNRELHDRFLEKFVGDKITVLEVWMVYYVAMRREIDKIEGIDREPKRVYF